jgi:hypothetical protein
VILAVLNIGVLAVLSVVAPSRAQVTQISTCFEEYLAPLRLNDLQDGIALCDKVIEDRTTGPERRGQAYAQRGLMYGRQWSILTTSALAIQGIADITEGLRLHSPLLERRHQLLFARARLYAAIGQNRRAVQDFTAILDEDPKNAAAREALARLSPQISN